MASTMRDTAAEGFCVPRLVLHNPRAHCQDLGPRTPTVVPASRLSGFVSLFILKLEDERRRTDELTDDDYTQT